MTDVRMTEREQQEFLAAKHIGVLSVQRADGPPLSVPLWYGYEPGGDVVLWTRDESTVKGRMLKNAGAFTLVVQNENLPYSYVSVSGPITTWEPSTVEDGLAVATRYIPEELAKEFVDVFNAGHVVVKMTPERWRGIDYSKTENIISRAASWPE